MGGIFEPVEVSFRGESWKVPANQVLGLIAVVEDEVTMAELYSGPKTTAVARAYSAAIRYAGGSATVSEVYEELFDPDSGQSIRGVIESLTMMMIPPKHLRDKEQEEEDVKPKKKT